MNRLKDECLYKSELLIQSTSLIESNDCVVSSKVPSGQYCPTVSILPFLENTADNIADSGELLQHPRYPWVPFIHPILT